MPLRSCGILVNFSYVAFSLTALPFLFIFNFWCRTVRAISPDRAKIVSGSDDQSVIVWDKQTLQLLEELKGHDAQVSTTLLMFSRYYYDIIQQGKLLMVNSE